MRLSPLLPNLPLRTINDPEIGDAIYFDLTAHVPPIQFNNFKKRAADYGYWVVTIFVRCTGSSEYELEFIYNRPANLLNIKTTVSYLAQDFVGNIMPDCDPKDLSGHHWTCQIMARFLRQKEIEEMREIGIEFHLTDQLEGEEGGVLACTYTDVLDLEDCVLLNRKPNLSKYTKNLKSPKKKK